MNLMPIKMGSVVIPFLTNILLNSLYDVYASWPFFPSFWVVWCVHVWFKVKYVHCVHHGIGSMTIKSPPLNNYGVYNYPNIQCKHQTRASSCIEININKLITCTLKKNGKGLEAIKLGENNLGNCPSLHKMLRIRLLNPLEY